MTGKDFGRGGGLRGKQNCLLLIHLSVGKALSVSHELDINKLASYHPQSG